MTEDQKELLKRSLIVLFLLIILCLAGWFARNANHRLYTAREWLMDSIWRVFVGVVVFLIIVALIIFILNRIGSKDLK